MSSYSSVIQHPIWIHIESLASHRGEDWMFYDVGGSRELRGKCMRFNAQDYHVLIISSASWIPYFDDGTHLLVPDDLT